MQNSIDFKSFTVQDSQSPKKSKTKKRNTKKDQITYRDHDRLLKGLPQINELCDPYKDFTSVGQNCCLICCANRRILINALTTCSKCHRPVCKKCSVPYATLCASCAGIPIMPANVTKYRTKLSGYIKIAKSIYSDRFLYINYYQESHFWYSTDLYALNLSQIYQLYRVNNHSLCNKKRSISLTNIKHIGRNKPSFDGIREDIGALISPEHKSNNRDQLNSPEMFDIENSVKQAHILYKLALSKSAFKTKVMKTNLPGALYGAYCLSNDKHIIRPEKQTFLNAIFFLILNIAMKIITLITIFIAIIICNSEGVLKSALRIMKERDLHIKVVPRTTKQTDTYISEHNENQNNINISNISAKKVLTDLYDINKQNHLDHHADSTFNKYKFRLLNSTKIDEKLTEDELTVNSAEESNQLVKKIVGIYSSYKSKILSSSIKPKINYPKVEKSESNISQGSIPWINAWNYSHGQEIIDGNRYETKWMTAAIQHVLHHSSFWQLPTLVRATLATLFNEPDISEQNFADFGTGNLMVAVHRAVGLLDGDINFFGYNSSTPYIVVQVECSSGITDVVSKTLNPIFHGESFMGTKRLAPVWDFKIYECPNSLQAGIFDWDHATNDDYLGVIDIPLLPLLKHEPIEILRLIAWLIANILSYIFLHPVTEAVWDFCIFLMEKSRVIEPQHIFENTRIKPVYTMEYLASFFQPVTLLQNITTNNYLLAKTSSLVKVASDSLPVNKVINEFQKSTQFLPSFFCSKPNNGSIRLLECSTSELNNENLHNRCCAELNISAKTSQPEARTDFDDKKDKKIGNLLRGDARLIRARFCHNISPHMPFYNKLHNTKKEIPRSLEDISDLSHRNVRSILNSHITDLRHSHHHISSTIHTNFDGHRSYGHCVRNPRKSTDQSDFSENISNIYEKETKELENFHLSKIKRTRSYECMSYKDNIKRRYSTTNKKAKKRKKHHTNTNIDMALNTQSSLEPYHLCEEKHIPEIFETTIESCETNFEDISFSDSSECHSDGGESYATKHSESYSNSVSQEILKSRANDVYCFSNDKKMYNTDVMNKTISNDSISGIYKNLNNNSIINSLYTMDPKNLNDLIDLENQNHSINHNSEVNLDTFSNKKDSPPTKLAKSAEFHNEDEIKYNYSKESDETLQVNQNRKLRRMGPKNSLIEILDLTENNEPKDTLMNFCSTPKIDSEEWTKDRKIDNIKLNNISNSHNVNYFDDCPRKENSKKSYIYTHDSRHKKPTNLENPKKHIFQRETDNISTYKSKNINSYNNSIVNQNRKCSTIDDGSWDTIFKNKSQFNELNDKNMSDVIYSKKKSSNSIKEPIYINVDNDKNIHNQYLNSQVSLYNNPVINDSNKINPENALLDTHIGLKNNAMICFQESVGDSTPGVTLCEEYNLIMDITKSKRSCSNDLGKTNYFNQSEFRKSLDQHDFISASDNLKKKKMTRKKTIKYSINKNVNCSEMYSKENYDDSTAIPHWCGPSVILNGWVPIQNIEKPENGNLNQMQKGRRGAGMALITVKYISEDDSLLRRFISACSGPRSAILHKPLIHTSLLRFDHVDFLKNIINLIYISSSITSMDYLHMIIHILQWRDLKASLWCFSVIVFIISSILSEKIFVNYIKLMIIIHILIYTKKNIKLFPKKFNN